MRLSTVFELLVIALLIAFAASRVIDGRDGKRTLVKDHRFAIGLQKDKDRKDRQNINPQNPPSRYCSCSSLTCNCCREFSLPIVPIKGPGCATVSYLHDDAMMVTMSFGERVLRNITINSKKPKPICMGMPGGISKFCGRLYSIKKEGENFKACLGLELRALDDVEAALRVSCFKFGPHGVNVEPGEAVPADKVKEEDEDDEDDYGFGDLDDDDDDDDFGLTGGEDDDYDDDDDDDDERPPAKDTYNDVDSSDSDADYTGLSSLSEEIFGGFFGSSSKKKRPIINNDDGEIYVPEPPNIQPPTQLQPQTQSQPPHPQVNVVVMHPVIIPTQTVLQPKPSVQKRPLRKRVNSTSPAPVKRVRLTTVAPVKKIRTTPVPLKTFATSTVSSEVQAINTTAKPPVKKKKKKPVRTRRPTKPKLNSTSSTEATPMIVTETTITVNVMQGGINLNETKPQTVQKPVKDAPLKIPMSKPVIETKPVEPIKQSDEILVTNMDKDVYNVSQEKESEKINAGIEKVNTETYESTTQTIMQNTIPIDESIDDKLNYMNAQKLPLNKPLEQQNGDILFEDMMLISTTPYGENTIEDTTNQETTAQEVTSYMNNTFDNSFKNSGMSITSMEAETAENFTELKDEMTTTASTNEIKKDEVKNEGTETIISENIAETQAMSSATESYYSMEEGTDKTETITKSSNKEESQENYSDEDENDDDDEDGIDLGADLGLEDDEDEEEEGNSKNNSEVNIKAEEKGDDDDDDDVLGGLLDDDDDDDEDDSKTKEKERTLGSNAPYQINPLLYRLARISSGSVATARHLPRFSEGRNRRNNKRMRFPSLEITP